MGRYTGYLVWWGPVLVALTVCALIYWHLRPDLSRLRVPRPPEVYRNLPRVSPEVVKYVPVSPVPIRGFEEPPPSASASPRALVSPRSYYELKAVLRVGRRAICKFEDSLFTVGDSLGPFKIVKIGENYVVLRGKRKTIRVFVGEKLAF